MNKPIFLSLPAAQAATGADGAMDARPDIRATHVAHTGLVRVDAPPRQAFQLFTAPGEKLWVPEWDPTVMSGGDGRERGAVFVTTHGDETTLWVVVDFNPVERHVRYARITPESRAGTVEVHVRRDGQGSSVAEVTYELTALNEAGNDVLAGFGQQQFAEMLTDWEEMISAAEIDYGHLVDDEMQSSDS